MYIRLIALPRVYRDLTLIINSEFFILAVEYTHSNPEIPPIYIRANKISLSEIINLTIQANDFDVFFDEWSLIPGQSIARPLADALRQSEKAIQFSARLLRKALPCPVFLNILNSQGQYSRLNEWRKC